MTTAIRPEGSATKQREADRTGATGLQVHHMQFRSGLRDDDLDNLIALFSRDSGAEPEPSTLEMRRQ